MGQIRLWLQVNHGWLFQKPLLCSADDTDTSEGVEVLQKLNIHIFNFQSIFAIIASVSVVWCYINSSEISEYMILILIWNLKPVNITNKTSLDFSIQKCVKLVAISATRH